MGDIIDRIDANKKIAKITLHNVVDRFGVAAEIFGTLGQHGLNVELISTSSTGRGRADIHFALMESDAEGVLKILETIKDKFGARDILINRDCALITIYGQKLATTPGVAGRIFGLLSQRGINIDMISASLSVLSIVVSKEKIDEAIAAIRTEFPQ